MRKIVFSIFCDIFSVHILQKTSEFFSAKESTFYPALSVSRQLKKLLPNFDEIFFGGCSVTIARTD